MNLKPLKRISVINACFWPIRPIGLLLLFAFMFPACSNAERKKEKQEAGIRQTPAEEKQREFPMTTIPPILTTPEDRAAYLTSHYWDHFDFSDTTLIHQPEITEQGFADYLSVLPHTTPQIAKLSIRKMLTASIEQDITGTMYPYFLNVYKDYLHDPNSPMRDEEYYIPVAEYIVEDVVSDEATKERAGFDLKLMMKNRLGSLAGDFIYLTIDGKKGSLHQLKTRYILLYFSNPDCGACKEMTGYLNSSPPIQQLLNEGSLSVLSIYPDEDFSLWLIHKGDIPPLWINARDANQSIRNKQLYDLKAIPCLYLLDKDKRVLLKDVKVEVLEQYLDTVVIQRE